MTQEPSLNARPRHFRVDTEMTSPDLARANPGALRHADGITIGRRAITARTY